MHTWTSDLYRTQYSHGPLYNVLCMMLSYNVTYLYTIRYIIIRLDEIFILTTINT